MFSARLNRKIIRLSLPAMVESLLLAQVLLIDTILVGWLQDPAALGAVALGGTFFFILQGIFMAIGVGSMALTSRAWGAGNRREANAVTAHAIGVSFVAGIVLSILCYWLVLPYLRLMGAEDQVVASGTTYLRILLYTAPVSLTMLVTFSNLRATGDTMTPLKINAVYNVLNIVLDVILIFGLGPIPALGLAGAAWATAIAGLIAGLMAFHKSTWRKNSTQNSSKGNCHLAKKPSPADAKDCGANLAGSYYSTGRIHSFHVHGYQPGYHGIGGTCDSA
ncbi:MAG: MATE family efflux transporter [Verrucomicrobia bacterium]|nr:MATE family efflux transporter [Verrucomicrobiota bacterium]